MKKIMSFLSILALSLPVHADTLYGGVQKVELKSQAAVADSAGYQLNANQGQYQSQASQNQYQASPNQYQGQIDQPQLNSGTANYGNPILRGLDQQSNFALTVVLRWLEKFQEFQEQQ